MKILLLHKIIYVPKYLKAFGTPRERQHAQPINARHLLSQPISARRLCLWTAHQHQSYCWEAVRAFGSLGLIEYNYKQL